MSMGWTFDKKMGRLMQKGINMKTPGQRTDYTMHVLCLVHKSGTYLLAFLCILLLTAAVQSQQLKQLTRILEKDGTSVGSGELLGTGLAVHPDINGDGFPDIL
jgi:hypothetical protein